MPAMKVCPHCNSFYERRIKIEGVYSCPRCYAAIKPDDIYKICPTCEFEFRRFPKAMEFEVLDIDSRPYVIKGGCCPSCSENLVYRRDRSGVVAITLDERLTADHLIQALNRAIRERHRNELHDLGEATGRERMAAYRMIEWADRVLDPYARQVGRSAREFLEGMVVFVMTKLDWYRINADSFLILWNKRARLATVYYEHMINQQADYNGRQEELEQALHSLRVKMEQLSLKGA